MVTFNSSGNISSFVTATSVFIRQRAWIDAKSGDSTKLYEAFKSAQS